MLNSAYHGQFLQADMEADEGAAAAAAPAPVPASVLALPERPRQAPDPSSNRSKKRAEQEAQKAEKEAFAVMLYETNHITARNLHELLSEFDFANIIINSNVDIIKTTYAISNNQIRKIWDKHSGHGNVANCMCCGIRKISVPNVITHMFGDRQRRHKTDEKNHPFNASSYLPNAMFVFRSTAQKQFIDGVMEEIRSREGSIDEAKAVWTRIQGEHGVSIADIVGIVCYHCYNFHLGQGSICMDGHAGEDHSAITPDKFIEHTYNYLVPFLIGKNRCIYNEGGRFCCRNTLSRESLKNCKPENLERVTQLVNGKEIIIGQRMAGYTEHMDLFICGRHRAAFAPAE